MASAQALTVTMTNPFADAKEQNTIVLDWTSVNPGGTVAFDIASTYATAQEALNTYLPQPTKIEGYIKAIETIPGEEGDASTDCPDEYDITLDDPYDYDLAGGSLADRSDSVAQKVVPRSPIPVDSEITLEITNAGNAKQGRIIIYVDPIP